MRVAGDEAKNRRRRLATHCSFRWLFICVIILAGVCQMAVLNHYMNIDNHHPSSLYDGHSSPSKNITFATNNDISISINSTPKRQKKNTQDVIVYLAQFGHHSSYGAQYDANKKVITGLTKLNTSLELLYTNYVNQFPTDVIIFYDDIVNAPDNATVALLQHNRPNLHFRQLDIKKWWYLPYGLQAWEHHVSWLRPAFSIGYRLMMRWYAILIWFYLDGEGYTHVMRLDDDSYILSEIQYNLFDYMRDNKKRYAFRQPVYEPGGDKFDALMDAYLLMENHPINNDATTITQESIDLYKRDRGVGFYNNFFIADVKFFMSPPASSLLRIIDESKMIFTERLGDLVIQSAVVRLFLKPEEVHWFQDFTYEHMTLCRKDKCGPMVHKGCPQNGGVSRGMGPLYTDAEWRSYATEEVQNRFKDNPKQCSVPINAHFVGAEDVRTCSRLHSRCGFYLKLLLGMNENATDDSSNLM